MRILIVRLSAMGDIIHAMPAVAGLRAQFSDSRIDWAIEERWSPLLTSRAFSDAPASVSPEQPLADFIHPVHMRRWRQHPFSSVTREEMQALRSGLRKWDYDHVIDFLNTFYPDTIPGTTADLFHSYTTANGAQDDCRTDTVVTSALCQN